MPNHVLQPRVLKSHAVISPCTRTVGPCLLVCHAQFSNRRDHAEEAWQLCLAFLQVHAGAADAVVHQADGRLAYDCGSACGSMERWFEARQGAGRRRTG